MHPGDTRSYEVVVVVGRHHRTGRRAALLRVDCAYQHVIWTGGSTRVSCLLLESWLGHSFLSPELRGFRRVFLAGLSDPATLALCISLSGDTSVSNVSAQHQSVPRTEAARDASKCSRCGSSMLFHGLVCCSQLKFDATAHAALRLEVDAASLGWPRANATHRGHRCAELT